MSLYGLQDPLLFNAVATNLNIERKENYISGAKNDQSTRSSQHLIL